MSDVASAVREFLAGEFPDRAAEVAALLPDAALFERGYLDSLSFLALVTFLEERYAIAVPARDFAPERFGSLAAIEAYVAHARRG